MKTTLFTLLLSSSLAFAAPSAPQKRQQNCPAPSDATCAELVTRCIAQGDSWHSNPFNNRLCVAAATCYGVGKLWDASSCQTGKAPAAPASVSGISNSLYTTITKSGTGSITQQQYLDFVFGTVQIAWPSSQTVVAWWTAIGQWTSFSGSIPRNNFSDWLKFSSTPGSTTPTPPTCSGPTDATCKDLVEGCIVGNTGFRNAPWGNKRCVAAATCYGVSNLFNYANCALSITMPAPASAAPLTNAVFSTITSGSLSSQNYIDLIYSTVKAAFPSSGSFVVSSWLGPIRQWTGASDNIPFANFKDWLLYSATVAPPTNPPTDPGNPPAGGNIRGVQRSCKHDVSISFDDGPYTSNGLIVDKFNAAGGKTTFFVNGDNFGCIYAEANVRALRKAYEAGHTIASHTWAHPNIAQISLSQLKTEVEKIETALWKIIGAKPAIIRPPFGSFNDAAVDFLNDRGYTVVTWDIDTGDSGGVSAQQTMRDLPGQVKAGSMILAHETVASTPAELVSPMISLVQQKGLQMVTVDQCLDVRPYLEVGSYGTRDASWTC